LVTPRVHLNVIIQRQHMLTPPTAANRELSVGLPGNHCPVLVRFTLTSHTLNFRLYTWLCW